MIRKLNGMFSIVVVDLRIDRMFVARDRFGIKPLYYSVQNECLYFASEIKALIQFREFKRELDTDAYYMNLLFPKLGERLIIKNVEALKPGTYITFNIASERVIISRNTYFDIDQYVERREFQKEEDALDELSFVLRNAVKRQLVSDVQVGCQVSGGIDSTLIAYYMLENEKGNTINAFSVVDPYDANEEKYVDHVEKQIGINLYKYKADVDFFINHYEDVIWYSDVPLHKAYASEYYKIAMNAREKNCTVLLSGEGADEIAGGYSRFANGCFVPFISSLKQNNSSITSYDSYTDYVVLVGSAYNEGIRLIPSKNNIDLFIKEYVDIFNGYTGSDFEKELKFETAYGLRDLLIRQDKMMMAWSIENRVPFLDNEVVDFMFSLPEDLLVQFADKSPMNLGKNIFTWVEGKYLLMALTAKKFGNEFAYRKKTGMAFNEKKIFGSPQFKDIYKRNILPGIKERGILDANKVDELYQNMDGNSVRQIGVMWRAMNMELWCQLFIDGRKRQEVV